MSEFEQDLQKIKEQQKKAATIIESTYKERMLQQEAARARLEEKRKASAEKTTSFSKEFLLPILQDVKKVFAPKDGKIVEKLSPTYSHYDPDTIAALDSHVGYEATVSLTWGEHHWEDGFSYNRLALIARPPISEEGLSISLVAGKYNEQEFKNKENEIGAIKTAVLKLLQSEECSVVERSRSAPDLSR